MDRKLVKRFVENLKNCLKRQGFSGTELYCTFNCFLAEKYIEINNLQEIYPFLKSKMSDVFKKNITKHIDIDIPAESFKSIEIFDLCFQYYNFDEIGYYKKTQFYTPKNIAEKICKKSITDKISNVLETSCGSGVFLREIYNTSLKFGRIPKIVAYDSDERAVQLAQISYTLNAFQKTGEKIFLDIKCKDFLPEKIEGKFDCIISNPPFLGRKLMPKYYMEYLSKNYNIAKENIAYGFLLKSLSLLNIDKNLTFIIPDNFLYLSNTQELKNHLERQYTFNIEKLDNNTFKDIFGAKLSVCIISVKNAKPKVHIENTRKSKTIGDIADVVTGIQTGNNAKYVRHFSKIADNEKANNVTQKNKKWYPYLMGGGYKKWTGNDGNYILFENNGELLRADKKSIIRNEKYFDKEGITYSYYSGNRFSARYKEKGTLFDIGGACLFFDNKDDLYYVLGFLNSSVCYCLLNKINPTMSFQTTSIKQLPLIISEKEKIIGLVKNIIKLSSASDKFFIDSKHFKIPDFIKNKDFSFEDAFLKSEEKYLNLQNKILIFENEINLIFENTYDIRNILAYKPKEKSKKYLKQKMLKTFFEWENIRNYDSLCSYFKANYYDTYEKDILFVAKIINGKTFNSPRATINKFL